MLKIIFAKLNTNTTKQMNQQDKQEPKEEQNVITKELLEDDKYEYDLTSLEKTFHTTQNSEKIDILNTHVRECEHQKSQNAID